MTNKKNKTEKNFEGALARLEEILEEFNKGDMSLDDSLKLYEEATTLINECGQKLVDAEKKVEILMKNREGELQQKEGVPETAPYDPQ